MSWPRMPADHLERGEVRHRASAGEAPPRYAALRDRHRRRPRPHRPRDRPVRGRRRRRGRHPRAHRRGAPRRRPRARLGLGPDRRPASARRSRRIDNTDVPGFAQGGRRRALGARCARCDRRHRSARPGLRHPHPLLRGPRRARGRPRRAHRDRGRLSDRRAHQRLRRAATHRGCRARRCSSRDHINLTATSPIEGAHFVDLTDLYSPAAAGAGREVDPTLDEGVYVQFRGPHYETPAEVGWPAHRRRPGGDVDHARGDRRPPEPAWRCSASPSSPTRPPASPATPLNHEEVLEAGRAAAERMGHLLADVISRI